MTKETPTCWAVWIPHQVLGVDEFMSSVEPSCVFPCWKHDLYVSKSRPTFVSRPIRASYRSSTLGPWAATTSCSSQTQHWHPGCSRVLQWQDVSFCHFFKFFLSICFPHLHPLLLLSHCSFILCPVSTPTMFTWLALVARTNQASRASTSTQSIRI